MYERTYNNKVLRQRAPEEDQKGKRRRRRFPLRRVIRVAIWILVGAIVVILIRLPQLRVTEVAVVGTNVADPEDVSLFVRSQIEGNFLYVFPKASMLLVPTASITKWTSRQFPRFESVDVRRKGVHGLIVTVVEHQGAYLWCGNEGQEDPSCFFMTKDGLVFAPAPFFSGDAYPKLYIGQKQELPFSPLTDKQLSTVQLLLERLPKVGIHPTAFREVSEHELDVIFSHNNRDARLMLDPDIDMEQVLENLATALATDPLHTSFMSSTKQLDYLDARFANKVVYKFK
jgi:hypothetical protein